jgi:hypothetical protein
MGNKVLHHRGVLVAVMVLDWVLAAVLLVLVLLVLVVSRLGTMSFYNYQCNALRSRRTTRLGIAGHHTRRNNIDLHIGPTQARRMQRQTS